VTGVAAIPVARQAVPPAVALPDVATVVSPQAQKPTEEPAPESVDAAQPSPALRQRDRRSWLPILGGLALVALLAVAALFLFGGGDDEETSTVTARDAVADQIPVDQLPADELPPPEDVAILVENAVRMAAEGDLDGALGAFEEAIHQDPRAVPIYMEMARALFERGEFDPAIDVLQRGVRANPEDVDLHLTLAQTLVSAERWDEALHDIEWLMEHVPDLAEPHAYLSIHLAINVGDVDSAQSEATTALKLNPESAEAHFAMGVFYWKTGRPLRARAELERARESPHASPFLRQRIQIILERLDQPDPDAP
jgi:Flp pilus assembly protein TadD